MMDYYFLGLAKCICLFLCALPTTYASHNDRDIILTPNKTHQHYGKIIYFKPIDEDESTSKQQRSLKENAPYTTQVPWEEPLKHATYLVLNNKFDGNDNSSDSFNKSQLTAATYLRGGQKPNLKFGDIVPLARGRLETNDNKQFFFIEMDRNECKKLNCSLNDNIDKNITAFWLVEKVRHRDETRGHRYELRITIFPIKKNRQDSKRETVTAPNQPKTRSFLIRDQDYPKYFDETMKPSSKIQKRFFDLMGSLSEHPYEEYRIPFTIDSYQNSNRYTDDLNTGEYYFQTNRNGEHFYQRPVAATAYGGHKIKFPDPSVATKEFLEATRNYPVNPFTATHLHHHYYLNRNNVPLIKATGFEKENIYEHPSEDYPHQGRIRNAQIEENAAQIHHETNNQQSSKEHQQEPSAAPQNRPITTAIGGGYNFYTEQPHPIFDVSESPGLVFANQQNYQTPYALTDQVPAPSPPLGQYYQTPYSYPLQLQVVTPPQQYIGSTRANAPITAAPFNLENVQQYPVEQFRPIIDFPSRFHHQQFPIQTNEVNANFNQQFEPNRYSEPDPIYHGENGPLGPYTRPVGFDPVIDIGNHGNRQQQRQPTQNPNENETKPKTEHALKIVSGGYEIGPNNDEKRSERNRVQSQTDVPIKQRERLENQTTYPDSINAQLPPPEQDDDLTVPYVESSVVTQTSFVQSTSESESAQNQRNSFEFERPKRIRGYYGRRTTEKPILKWMPKKSKPRESSPDVENVSASSVSMSKTTEDVITVTPINSHIEEPQTSISTSISIQVGPNPSSSSKVAALSDTSNVSPHKPVGENSYGAEFKTFLPTVIPNIQLVKGNVEAIDTNSSDFKLFKSGEAVNDSDEANVAEAIITHARNL